MEQHAKYLEFAKQIFDIDNFEEERLDFYDYRLNMANNKILKLSQTIVFIVR